MNDPVLKVKDLQISFKTDQGVFNAINNISFNLEQRHTLGIVGESASGKSQTVLALMGLLSNNAIVSGQAIFCGKNLINMPAKSLNKIRGSKIAMIFQDPMSSLNPYLKIHKQLLEPLITHNAISKHDASKRVLEMLDAVKIPDAKNRVNLYPHEFSGGMRQRVVIAMALLCKPEILIADEPTTALDVTVQAQILQLLSELQKDFGMSMLFITHDLGVVAETCDSVMVIYGGRVMESGTVEKIFAQPEHPYTVGLLNAVPSLNSNNDFLKTIAGEPPSIQNMPKGCPFSTRCAKVTDLCQHQAPKLKETFKHKVACHNITRVV